jgi:hypothetical protein
MNDTQREGFQAANSAPRDMLPGAQVDGSQVLRTVWRLESWPDMRRVPADRLLICARVCALLAHVPSAEYLIHRRLGLTAEEVQPLLGWLRSEGHVVTMKSGGGASASAGSSEPDGVQELAPLSGARGSMWGRLLRRLMS